MTCMSWKKICGQQTQKIIDLLSAKTLNLDWYFQFKLSMDVATAHIKIVLMSRKIGLSFELKPKRQLS
jgi:hypothetical protein